MRHPVPTIREEVAALKARRQPAHDGHTKPRLQLLSLLASVPAQTRQDVARLLGVHRHTLSRWLALDATGGLEALLATSSPPGQTGLPGPSRAREPGASPPPSRGLCLV
jgi:Homeodomain-like domain